MHPVHNFHSATTIYADIEREKYIYMYISTGTILAQRDYRSYRYIHIYIYVCVYIYLSLQALYIYIYLQAQYFQGTTGIAASFHGEVPHAFFTIRAVFGSSADGGSGGVAAGAFIPGDGVADYPPQPDPAAEAEVGEPREVSREAVLRYLGRTADGYQAQMTGLNTLNRKEL